MHRVDYFDFIFNSTIVSLTDMIPVQY